MTREFVAASELRTDGVEDALEHPELSPRLRQELAETISTRQVSVEVSEPETLVKID